MAIAFGDRVFETTTTQGTGTLTLDGPVTGSQAFSAVIGNGLVFYTLQSESLASWEIGIGTHALGPSNTLARTIILDSSENGAAISLPAGQHSVFLGIPSAFMVLYDENQDVPLQPSTRFLGNLIARGTFPRLELQETAAATDMGRWRVMAQPTGELIFQALDDAGNGGTDRIEMTRTAQQMARQSWLVNGQPHSWFDFDTGRWRFDSRLELGTGIHNFVQDQSIQIASGDEFAQGANMLLHGPSHPASPGLTRFRDDATVVFDIYPTAAILYPGQMRLGFADAPFLYFQRNQDTPTYGAGSIYWIGRDSAGAQKNYGIQTLNVTDDTPGAEDGQLYWNVLSAGATIQLFFGTAAALAEFSSSFADTISLGSGVRRWHGGFYSDLLSVELSDSDQFTLFSTAYHASYNQTMVRLDAARSASTAFQFEEFRANNDAKWRVDGTGQGYSDAGINLGTPAGFGEMKETEDGTDIPVGTPVVFSLVDPDKVRPALANEIPIGVIAPKDGSRTLLANTAWSCWRGKHLRGPDDCKLQESYRVIQWTETIPARFETREEQAMEIEERDEVVFEREGERVIRRIKKVRHETPLFEDLPVYDEAGEDTGSTWRVPVMTSRQEEVEPARTVEHSYAEDEVPEGVTPPPDAVYVSEDEDGAPFMRPIVSRDYDATKAYVPRQQRQEWVAVELLGEVAVLQGAPTAPHWHKMGTYPTNAEIVSRSGNSNVYDRWFITPRSVGGGTVSR